MIILPNIPEVAAVRVADNIRRDRKAISRFLIPGSPVGPYVTISVGVATTVPSHYGTCQELLQEADRRSIRPRPKGVIKRFSPAPVRHERVDAARSELVAFDHTLSTPTNASRFSDTRDAHSPSRCPRRLS